MSDEKTSWIRFTPGLSYPPATDMVELTDEQAHELRMFDFGRLVTVMRELVYFTVRTGSRSVDEVHYVLAKPSASAGRSERDGILARYGAFIPLHAVNPDCWRSSAVPITRCGLSRGGGALMTSLSANVSCAGCRASLSAHSPLAALVQEVSR